MKYSAMVRLMAPQESQPAKKWRLIWVILNWSTLNVTKYNHYEIETLKNPKFGEKALKENSLKSKTYLAIYNFCCTGFVRPALDTI
jgi:hypothetical protein